MNICNSTKRIWSSTSKKTSALFSSILSRALTSNALGEFLQNFLSVFQTHGGLMTKWDKNVYGLRRETLCVWAAKSCLTMLHTILNKTATSFLSIFQIFAANFYHLKILSWCLAVWVSVDNKYTLKYVYRVITQELIQYVSMNKT